MKKLFLLDGMALAYRAHFAFMSRPIYNSKGMNTSALYGFTTTLLDLIASEKPTHLAIAFDTPEPTERHKSRFHLRFFRDPRNGQMMQELRAFAIVAGQALAA